MNYSEYFYRHGNVSKSFFCDSGSLIVITPVTQAELHIPLAHNIYSRLLLKITHIVHELSV